MYHGQTVFKGIHSGNDLLVNIKEEGVIVPHLPREVFPEYYLIRVNAYDKLPENPLDEWLTYLKTGKIKEDTHTPGLQAVREKLRVLAMSKKERQAYDAHIENIRFQNDVLNTAREEGREEGFDEGRAEGRAEGIEIGLEKGRIETLAIVVRAMKLQGMAMEEIIKLTGLTADEINAL